MITKFEIRPVSGSPIELNLMTAGIPIYPLSVCDIFTNMDTKEFKRMAAAGEWPSFSYPGALTVHVEGKVIGAGATDALASADYVTKRLALLDAVLPPIQTLTSRKHAVLRCRLDGMTEDADTDVIVTSPQIPMVALYPAISEFMITWKGFNPYFTGVTTSTKYQLG
jgi:hypothetical protein